MSGFDPTSIPSSAPSSAPTIPLDPYQCLYTFSEFPVAWVAYCLPYGSNWTALCNVGIVLVSIAVVLFVWGASDGSGFGSGSSFWGFVCEKSIGPMHISPHFPQGNPKPSGNANPNAHAAGSASTSPTIYPHADVNNMPGLVVKVSDALEWFKLYKGNTKGPQFTPAPRYLISANENIPFAMISYNSALARDAQGQEDLIALVEHVQREGYEYLWWDWMVIINPKPPADNYKQAEFEQTMAWATNNASVVAVCWPTYDAVYQYLDRPWCIAELLCAIRRGVFRIYSREQNAMLAFLPLLINRMALGLLCIPAFAVLSVIAFIPFCTVILPAIHDPREYDHLGVHVLIYDIPAVRVLLLYGLFLNVFFDVPYRLVMEKVFQRPVYRPFGLPAELMQELVKHSTDYTPDRLVGIILKAGYLTGKIFDLADAPSCAITMGISAEQFTFAQATLHMQFLRDERLRWYRKKLLSYVDCSFFRSNLHTILSPQQLEATRKKFESCPVCLERYDKCNYKSDFILFCDCPDCGSLYSRCSRKDAFTGCNASWLNGKLSTAGGPWQGVLAIGDNFSGATMLSWSSSLSEKACAVDACYCPYANVGGSPTTDDAESGRGHGHGQGYEQVDISDHRQGTTTLSIFDSVRLREPILLGDTSLTLVFLILQIASYIYGWVTLEVVLALENKHASTVSLVLIVMTFCGGGLVCLPYALVASGVWTFVGSTLILNSGHGLFLKYRAFPYFLCITFCALVIAPSFVTVLGWIMYTALYARFNDCFCADQKGMTGKKYSWCNMVRVRGKEVENRLIK